jgi:hypothetical protein
MPLHAAGGPVNPKRDELDVALEDPLRSVSYDWEGRDIANPEDALDFAGERERQEAAREKRSWMKPYPNDTELPQLASNSIYPQGGFNEYLWQQNSDLVWLFVPVQNSISKEDVNISVTASTVDVVMEGEHLLSFRPYGTVKNTESFWYFEDVGERKYVLLELVKALPYRTWDWLFQLPPEEDGLASICLNS